MMQTSEIHTMVIDDDEVTVMGVERAFKRANVDSPLHVARDGMEALDMLRGSNGHEGIPRPHVLFLDLNMPRMNGFEFLKEIRTDERLRDTVIFVLTSSSKPDDRREAYGHAIAGYIDKAKAGASYQELLNLLEPYWKLVDLPS